MSFMGGSMCAQGSNPLAQMAKQQNVDRTHQFEHQQGRHNVGGASALRSDANRQMSAQDHQMLQQMDRNSPAFQFQDMRGEIQQLPQAQLQGQSQAQWAKDFHQTSNKQWASEFKPQQHSPQPQQQLPQHQHTQHQAGLPSSYSGYQQRVPFVSQMGGMRFNPASQSQHLSQSTQMAPDAQWEEQFKSVEAQTSVKQDATNEAATREADGDLTNRIHEVDAQTILQENDLAYEDAEEITEWVDSDRYPPGWDNLWSHIKDQMKDTDGETAHQRSGDVNADIDWDTLVSSHGKSEDYQFDEENPYLEEQDPFAMGVAMMDQGGKLSVAVLCFEAALQRDPNHVEAWSRLGAAQAQNEFEDQAISALEQCIKLDPNNEQALMNLAVSYTNEGYESAAYATLELWLQTKYPELVKQARQADADLDRLAQHKRVTSLFIQAAQMSPDGANMDVDVQAGLGVLFYGEEEYSKAVDCFRAALSARPNDPLLWNRLGATLANSSRSEEAIEAYYKALELRPSFVRARYNVGVSCINIGCYHEAAEHLLAAVSLHQTQPGEPGTNSTNLCETLRRVFVAMDRRDLMDRVKPNMDLEQFRTEFKF